MFPKSLKGKPQVSKIDDLFGNLHQLMSMIPMFKKMTILVVRGVKALCAE